MSAAAHIWAMVSGLPSGQRERRLMMPIQAWIDDSGNAPNQHFLVLGGFISTAGLWADFSDAWQAVLDIEPRLAYFKMNEAVALQEQFARQKGWDESKRDARLLLFASVIKAHVQARVSVSIEHRFFEKYVKGLDAPERRLASDMPYMLLFTDLITTTALYAPRLGINGPCDFFFDEQGAYMDEAYHFWPLYRDHLANSRKPETDKFIGSRPTFRNDKEFLPLQAADLYSWEVRRNLIENKHLYMPPHAVLRSLESIPPIRRDIGESELSRVYLSLLKVRAAYVAQNPNVPLIAAGAAARRRSKKKRRLANVKPFGGR